MHHPSAASGTAGPPGEPIPSNEGRASLLLRRMAKVAGHDLPNQMVALQSLLQLLEMEEGDRLSEDGRDYVSRLGTVAHKAAAMARFLKEMGRLNSHQTIAENIQPSLLLPDLRSHLEQTYPDTAFSFATDWGGGRLRVDVRLLRLALAEILLFVVGPAPGPRCGVRIATKNLEGMIEISGSASPSSGAANPLSKPLSEPPMELILVEEWLTTTGGRLGSVREAGGARQFSLLVPTAAGHG